MAAAAVKFILFIRIYKWPDIVEEDMDGGLKAGYGDPVAAAGVCVCNGEG